MNYKTDMDVDKVEELVDVSKRILDGEQGAVLKDSLIAASGMTLGMTLAQLALGATPVTLALGAAIWAWKGRRHKDRLRQRKEALIIEAVRVRDAVISELQEKTCKAQERIDALTKVNAALQGAIIKLEQDIK